MINVYDNANCYNRKYICKSDKHYEDMPKRHILIMLVKLLIKFDNYSTSIDSYLLKNALGDGARAMEHPDCHFVFLVINKDGIIRAILPGCDNTEHVSSS